MNSVKFKLIKNISFFFLLLVFFAANISFAQNNEKTASNKTAVENSGQKLQQKILLSDAQTSKVENILSKYSDEIKDNKYQNANKEIISLLDDKQSAKYDIIKDDWWKSVKKEFSKKEQ